MKIILQSGACWGIGQPRGDAEVGELTKPEETEGKAQRCARRKHIERKV